MRSRPALIAFSATVVFVLAYLALLAGAVPLPLLLHDTLREGSDLEYLLLIGVLALVPSSALAVVVPKGHRLRALLLHWVFVISLLLVSILY